MISQCSPSTLRSLISDSKRRFIAWLVPPAAGSLAAFFLIGFSSLDSLGAAGSLKGAWPQWRGPNRDGHALADPRDAAALATLPAQLEVSWRLKVGGGFSSPVVAGDHVAYMDENGTGEVMHVIESASGREIWKQEFGPRYSDEWGAGTRSSPLIDGERVYGVSCTGELRCWELRTGKVMWGVSFEKDFGVKFLGSKAREGTASRRGNNGSPLIEGNAIVALVGNPDGSGVVSFDKVSGKVLWKSGNDEAAYSSPVVGEFSGIKQVVAFNAEGLAGYRLSDGKELWRTPLVTAAKRHVATPVIHGNTVTVNSHTFGTICFEISRQGDGFVVNKKWANAQAKINIATTVLVGGYLYGQGPTKDFICVDVATGALKWSQQGFGKENTSTLEVGGRLLALTDDGQLMLISPNHAKYEELGRSQVCGKNWNHPAYADGKLLVRDAKELVCYKVR